MELTDPKLIASLQAENPRNAPTRRDSPQSPSAARAVRPRRRCLCGQCNTCVENARWEKIFNDKFADPDYYQPKPVRYGSSLDWIPK